MTSKTDILHSAFRANGFEPDEKLSPLAHIAAADALASRCVELGHRKEAEADSLTFFGIFSEKALTTRKYALYCFLTKQNS